MVLENFLGACIRRVVIIPYINAITNESKRHKNYK